MTTKPGHLTAMERTFSAYMATTGDRIYAAAKAGYSSPRQAASQNLQNADVVEDIRRNARNLLQNHGAQIGVAVLIEIACDEKQKGSTRGAAAKSLVQLSGISSAATLSEADLAELPADKIRALLHEAQRALDARTVAMKTIEHEPAAPVEPASIFG
jgi:hypothetical protein